MKEVSQGDFEQHLETNSRIAEVVESYQSFNVMTKELRATEVLQMDFVSNVSHEFKTPLNAIEGYTTVSYTHLDVYKRQVLDTSGCFLYAIQIPNNS